MITKTSNPYSFDSFLESRNSLNALENPFLLQVYQRYSDKEWNEWYQELKAFSTIVSGKWRALTEENARVENHPRLRHFDAHNHRIDRIVRPQEMHELEKEVFSAGLFSQKVSKRERTMKRFLIHHNGEAGVACPLACTDGLIALLERFRDDLSPEVVKILEHSKEGRNGDFAIGAQFMSEIQGGSNIPANVLEAVPDGDHYNLYGNKFFCSAVHADYSVVTAKVKNTDHVGVFIVPTWLEGDKEKERRNGHVLNRLKWKLGTCELPSAEIDYRGAVAYPIGPIEKGVSIAVGIVLTLSRIDIGFASAAFMMRAAREATLYARFRSVFGRKIDEFPMAKGQLLSLQEAAKRSTATAFKIFEEHLLLEESPIPFEKKQLDIRILILIQKVFSAKETVEALKTTISLFGGHGAIEDFSSIPRLFRDAMVNELWEGPRNVLLSQVYRDLKKNESWYPPEELIANLLNGHDQEIIQQYSSKLRNLLSINLYDAPNEETISAARQWEQLWSDLFHLYQRIALNEFPEASLIPEEILEAVY
ncbi:acyl-CoA dehydrogenase [Bacillus sp. CH30_1T]|uniref:acyl-CoA dehydrogenase family protein n=1 Tax=Bacillus sp. CH30_1T TaxID=2604836 RepID=UPI0011EF2C63|nr:acyl-CoA dehydrogenase family protein [Bacillus sp. CH30_1T]KAA0566689.1 acyl-CoA dehydrogenase [Bacillus sp. CH30_1T]